MKAKKITLAKRFEGAPKPSDFKIIEEEVPEELQNGVSFDYSNMIYKQIRMEGFMVIRWFQEWKDGIAQMAEWIRDGKIQVRETHTKGFENMPRAFIDLLEGRNVGKAIVVA